MLHTLAALLLAALPADDKAFDALTRDQIKAHLENADTQPRAKIDGGKLPAGAVVAYRTSEGRLGKLLVVETGYDLTVKYVTYAADGAVYSTGDKLVIRGTWSADLDDGKETTRDERAKQDFRWEQVGSGVRNLDPRNKAVFAVYTPQG
jgi:hypothetical protein